MKKVIFLALAISALGCKSSRATAPKMENKTVDLIGKHSVKELLEPPYRDWFSKGYENYTPDEASMEKLKSLTNNISITIFMGTWCRDSQQQVPHFYKILHQLGIEEKNVTLIAMDRNKTTPEQLEAGLSITNVPTFIFYKTLRSGRRKRDTNTAEKTKELNRIVESPVESLEKDMLKILSGQKYTNTYQK
jgi:thiol-disulfide isomerase/thioredoxin